MHYKFNAMEPTTGFGKWLYTKMYERGMSCSDVAKQLHITRQAIRVHLNGEHPPKFPFVVAYCWLFNDDPNRVWKLVEKDMTPG